MSAGRLKKFQTRRHLERLCVETCWVKGRGDRRVPKPAHLLTKIEEVEVDGGVKGNRAVLKTERKISTNQSERPRQTKASKEEGGREWDHKVSNQNGNSILENRVGLDSSREREAELALQQASMGGNRARGRSFPSEAQGTAEWKKIMVYHVHYAHAHAASQRAGEQNFKAYGTFAWFRVPKKATDKWKITQSR